MLPNLENIDVDFDMANFDSESFSLFTLRVTAALVARVDKLALENVFLRTGLGMSNLEAAKIEDEDKHFFAKVGVCNENMNLKDLAKIVMKFCSNAVKVLQTSNTNNLPDDSMVQDDPATKENAGEQNVDNGPLNFPTNCDGEENTQKNTDGKEDEILEICSSPFSEEIQRLLRMETEKELTRIERQRENLRKEFEEDIRKFEEMYPPISPLPPTPEHFFKPISPILEHTNQNEEDPRPYKLEQIETEGQQGHLPRFKFATKSDPRLKVLRKKNKDKKKAPRCLNCKGKHLYFECDKEIIRCERCKRFKHLTKDCKFNF